MRKFGLHISGQDAVNSGWVQKFNKSPVHLVLADSIGSEISRTLEVAALAPQSKIVYRAWSYGGLGQSDHFEWYHPRFGSDPTPLIDAHRECFDAFAGIRDRIFIQLWNETGMNNESWPAFIDFNTRFIKQMDELGWSASIFGAGPGFPTGTRDEIKNKWRQARPIWEAINNAKHPFLINLHEYIGYPHTDYKPFLCGRFQYLLEDLAEMGLLTDRIRIVAGENGWADPAVLNPAYPPNPANGFRGFLMKGITSQQLADDLNVAFKTIYDPNPYFVGSAHFCVGGNGWAEFNLMTEPSLLEAIHQHYEEISAVIIDTPVIEFKVINGPLNIRTNYATSAPIVGQYQVGEIIKTNGYVDTGTFRWRRIDGTGNWCAEHGISGVVFLEEYVPPIPTWKTEVKELLDDIRFEIVTIQNDLTDLQALIDNA